MGTCTDQTAAWGQRVGPSSLGSKVRKQLPSLRPKPRGERPPAVVLQYHVPIRGHWAGPAAALRQESSTRPRPGRSLVLNPAITGGSCLRPCLLQPARGPVALVSHGDPDESPEPLSLGEGMSPTPEPFP